MIATHRVRDNNKTIGFIVNGVFASNITIRQNIGLIDNLKITKNGVIKAKKRLHEVTYRDSVIRSLYNKLMKNNPFVRDIQKDLMHWKQDPEHGILQLEGARQIGKTTEILKFAYRNYKYVIYVNLASDMYKFQKACEQDINYFTMLDYTERAHLPGYVDNRDTILIIDEIQENMEMYNNIRTFANNLNCEIIVTGSYLGRLLVGLKKPDEDTDKKAFIPTGIDLLNMYPLSFAEFCRVFNAEDTLMSISLYGESSDRKYKKLDKLYDIYRQIGGYPAVIKEYIKTQDISACHMRIGNLLELFKAESREYFHDEVEIEIFDMVYDYTLYEMCSNHAGTDKRTIKDVTRIVEDKTKGMTSTRELRNAITWLRYSGILGTCILAENGETSFSTVKKFYFIDCGVTSYLAKRANIDASSLDGIITETFAFDELIRLYSKNTKDPKVRPYLYYGRLGNYELNFLVCGTDNNKYGIEIKTNTGDPKSLKQFLNKRIVDKGIVAKRTKGGHSEKLDTIPIYTVGCGFPYK